MADVHTLALQLVEAVKAQLIDDARLELERAAMEQVRPIRRILGRQQVADKFGVSPKTIDRWSTQPDFPKCGQAGWFEDELDAWNEGGKRH